MKKVYTVIAKLAVSNKRGLSVNVLIDNKQAIATDNETTISTPFLTPVACLIDGKMFGTVADSLTFNSVDYESNGIVIDSLNNAVLLERLRDITAKNIDGFIPDFSVNLDSVEQAMLFDANLLKFAAKNDVRHYLNGVLMRFYDNTHCDLIASDGHRLLSKTTRLDGHKASEKKDFLIPRNAFKILCNMVKEKQKCSVQFGAIHYAVIDNIAPAPIDTMRVTYTSGVQIYVKLIDSSYPDFSRALSQNFTNVTLDLTQLTRELKTVKPFIDTKLNSVKLDFSGTECTVLNASDKKLFSVNCSHHNGIIALNYSYLLDCLSVVSNTDKLQIMDDVKGLLFESADYKAVIMSMRL